MLALALTPLALAAPELSLATGYTRATWYEDIGSYRRAGPELSALLRWEPGVELEVGGRWNLYGFSTLPPVDVFVVGRAAPDFGAWRPAVGLELAFTGALTRDYDAIEDVDWEGRGFSDLEARTHPDLFYAQAVAEPLRFRVSRFTLSLASVGLGGALPHFGSVARVELGWARLEVAL